MRSLNPKQLQLQLIRCSKKLHQKTFLNALFSTSTIKNEEPFYGSPRPFNESSHLTPLRNLGIALTSATKAFLDPDRHEAVASLAEVTSLVALESLQNDMMMHPIGQRILTEKPIVNLETINIKSLQALPTNTFGHTYAQFLKSHEFNPNDRAPIQHQHVFTSTQKDLSYILLRYRQCHDFYHVLTDLPPSIPGELALKYVELFQTGLPVCALSATVGSLKLDATQRQIWTDLYLPWAVRVGKRRQGATSLGESVENGNEELNRRDDLWMLNVYWEEEFECDLNELRARLGVEVAPRMGS